MILKIFEMDYQYFPTLREIRDGLIKAQIKQLEKDQETWSDKTRFHLMKDSYIYNWQKLFSLSELKQDLDKPLTAKILSNANHKITKHLLYIYSMECFIYTHLNRACRDKNLK